MRSGYERMKMKKKLRIAFGVAIGKLRSRRKWSQEHLGFEADLSRAYISLLELGKRSPTLNTMYDLATAFDIEVDELVKLALLELENHDHRSP